MTIETNKEMLTHIMRQERPHFRIGAVEFKIFFVLFIIFVFRLFWLFVPFPVLSIFHSATHVRPVSRVAVGRFPKFFSFRLKKNCVKGLDVCPSATRECRESLKEKLLWRALCFALWSRLASAMSIEDPILQGQLKFIWFQFCLESDASCTIKENVDESRRVTLWGNYTTHFRTCEMPVVLLPGVCQQ